MTALDEIVKRHDVLSREGFNNAMTEARNISEGELRFFLSYSSDGQSSDFKKKIAVAKAEIDRRQIAEQRKLAWITAAAGIAGVIVGAIITFVLTKYGLPSSLPPVKP